MGSTWATVMCALPVGGAAAWLMWAVAAAVLDHPTFRRANYRDHELLTAAGVVFAAVCLLVGAVGLFLSAVTATRWIAVPTEAARRMAPGVLGLVLFGLVDDLVGAGQHGGFRRHLGELAHGRVTSGMLKILGGGLVGLWWAAAPRPWIGDVAGSDTGRRLVAAVQILVDAAGIALWANVGNLFDRAPGRAIKVSTAVTAVVVVAAALCHKAPGPLAGPLLIAGAALVLLVFDLDERIMLGDAGSMVVGVVPALAALWVFGGAARWVVLGVGLALNLISERVSFTRVIDRVAVLRWIDRLGARHRPPYVPTKEIL